jgi:hypothetical protein
MARLPGHCHRLHPADRLPVDPLLPGGIPATAPPARRPHRRGPGPPLPRSVAEHQGVTLTRSAANRRPSAFSGTQPTRSAWPSSGHSCRRGRPTRPPRTPGNRPGWPAKAARVVKGMDPVPNWHICVQGSRYRIVNASRKYSARVSEFLAARSFRHCRCMAGFGRSEHDHLCPRPETHLTYMINLAPVPALAR